MTVQRPLVLFISLALCVLTIATAIPSNAGRGEFDAVEGELTRGEKNLLDLLTITRLMTPLNQGEILIQQHYGGGKFFVKSWAEYKNGFGDMNSDYWFGNEWLHWLTGSRRYRLRVDMLAKNNQRWYHADYSTFIVSDEAGGYNLTIGGYSGTAGDSLGYSNGAKFSTRDKDQDTYSDSCANHVVYGNGAGFWYKACARAWPNSPHDGTNCFVWYYLPIGSTTADRKLHYIRMTITLSG